MLHYLKWTCNRSLFIKKCIEIRLTTFSDADWAGCPDDGQSTSGFLIYLGNNLLAWNSNKQSVVACHSTESESRLLQMFMSNLNVCVNCLKSLVLI